MCQMYCHLMQVPFNFLGAMSGLSCHVRCFQVNVAFYKSFFLQTPTLHIFVSSNYARDVHMLQAFHVYLSILQEQSSSNLSCQQNFKDVYACIKENLASHARLVRLLTLKILTTFDQLEATFMQVCLYILFTLI